MAELGFEHEFDLPYPVHPGTLQDFVQSTDTVEDAELSNGISMMYRPSCCIAEFTDCSLKSTFYQRQSQPAFSDLIELYHDQNALLFHSLLEHRNQTHSNVSTNSLKALSQRYCPITSKQAVTPSPGNKNNSFVPVFMAMISDQHLLKGSSRRPVSDITLSGATDFALTPLRDAEPGHISSA
jgi:hypothetical protein